MSLRAPLQRGSFEVAFAQPRDDEAIRALLRRHAMGGAIELTLEREPDTRLAAAVEGDPHHTVIVREQATGNIVGVGARSVRDVWFNGRPARLGYLGMLRREPQLLGHRHVLQQSLELLESTRGDDELRFDLTSIVTDNHAARRLLERGLRGLPTYTPWVQWVTLMIPTTRRAAPIDPDITAARRDDLPHLTEHLNRHYRARQFAPRITSEELLSPGRSRGLALDDFLLLRCHGEILGCMACWDQRSFKQVVVRRYSPGLTIARPLVNGWLRLSGQPCLPAPGQALRMGYLSHVATDEDPSILARLVQSARAMAAARGLDYLALGLCTTDPALLLLCQRFKPRTYHSNLYLVSSNERAVHIELPDGRQPWIEIATL